MLIPKITIGAFVLAKKNAKAIADMQQDRMFMRSTVFSEEGGIGRATAFLAEHETPDLLIIESTSKGDDFYDELAALADVCDPGSKVILIGAQNDISLYRELVHQGVSQYFFGTVTSDDLRAAVAESLKDESDARSARVISFYGVRGGVGSSVLACNTAYELSRTFNEDVVVVDLDIPFGTAALNFNIQPRQTVADALSQTGRLDDVIIERILEDCTKDVKILASPASLGSGVQINIEDLDKVMKFVVQMASYVIIDVPHVWQSWVHELLSDSNEVVLVALPDLCNLRDSKNLVEILSPKRGVDAPMRVVLSRVGEAKKTELSAKDFKDVLGIEPVVSVPHDPATFGAALNNGDMISRVGEKTKAAEAIIQIAKVVSAKTTASDAGSKFSFFSKKN
ncbi:MAG: AAA family ATPase [Rhodospirillaceae bacterium]|nr:AAA family ATPase [Rhodospirillaceae bacterium]MBT5751810.1 AAA family ATPase [Rhodospirillaceae bacterium]